MNWAAKDAKNAVGAALATNAVEADCIASAAGLVRETPARFYRVYRACG